MATTGSGSQRKRSEEPTRAPIPAEVGKSRSKGQGKNNPEPCRGTGAEKTYAHISLSAPKLSDVLGDHQGLGVLWAFRVLARAICVSHIVTLTVCSFSADPVSVVLLRDPVRIHLLD